MASGNGCRPGPRPGVRRPGIRRRGWRGPSGPASAPHRPAPALHRPARGESRLRRSGPCTGRPACRVPTNRRRAKNRAGRYRARARTSRAPACSSPARRARTGGPAAAPGSLRARSHGSRRRQHRRSRTSPPPRCTRAGRRLAGDAIGLAGRGRRVRMRVHHGHDVAAFLGGGVVLGRHHEVLGAGRRVAAGLVPLAPAGLEHQAAAFQRIGRHAMVADRLQGLLAHASP